MFEFTAWLLAVLGGVTEARYLQLQDFVSGENVIWVDTADGLANALRDISTFEIVGIDSEWRPNRLKGEKMNKVLHDPCKQITVFPFQSDMDYVFIFSGLLWPFEYYQCMYAFIYFSCSHKLLALI